MTSAVTGTAQASAITGTTTGKVDTKTLTARSPASSAGRITALRKQLPGTSTSATSFALRTDLSAASKRKPRLGDTRRGFAIANVAEKMDSR